MAGAAVDVVIAARDEAVRLDECLVALGAQDHAGPITVVVVDDASTDGTADVARRRGATVLRGAGAGPAAARKRRRARRECAVRRLPGRTFGPAAQLGVDPHRPV